MRFGLLFVLVATACGAERDPQPSAPITVFAAASLVRPLAAIRDSFQQARNIPALIELGGSLEQSRKISDLGRVPDVLMLADDEVVAALVPTYLDWYVRFATNRLVVAYTERSRGADSITAENWWRVLSRTDVGVGRADPDIAPAGRYALEMVQRTGVFYQLPGLADSILARSPKRLLRPNATELAALLEAGEVDYVIEYQSVAQQYGFRFVDLPAELSPAVLYGVSVPRQSTRSEDAVAFVAYVLSDQGKAILREGLVDVLPVPIAIGTKIPPEITDVARTLATAATAPR